MTTHKCRDASAFYSLRQHLLCVIAPSPTRFTPYILSSSHLPHLQLPLCHPLTPSLSFFPLSLSYHPFLFLFPSAFLPIFIHLLLPFFLICCCSWPEVQLYRYRSRATSLVIFPLGLWSPPQYPSLPTPQWQHVFSLRCCLMSLC